MTDLPMPKPAAADAQRRSEDEEEVIRRLSAEAKLRIYEEIKELLDAKAARDARRAASAGRTGTLRNAGSRAETPAPTQARPPSAPKAQPRKSDATDDVLVFNEDESYDLKSAGADAESALDPSVFQGMRSAGRRSGQAGRQGAAKNSAKSSAKSAAVSAPPQEAAAGPPKRFTLLTGLEQNQVRMLKDCGSRQKYEEGETVFTPGDPAQGTYIILRGRVEVAGEYGDSEQLTPRRTGEWFGELELMTGSAHRQATARAAKPTSLFEIPGNPIELFRWLSDRKAAMRLLRNAICLMGRHLREIGEGEEVGSVPDPDDPEGAALGGTWEAGSVALPQELLNRVKKCRSFTELRLLDGQHLYREGDAPEGFYFVKTGTLDIFRQSSRGRSRKLTTLRGPLVIGDVSFFSHRKRSVGLRAFGPVEVLKFSGERFDRVRKRDTEETLDLLVLCAELAAGLLRVRQHAAQASGPDA